MTEPTYHFIVRISPRPDEADASFYACDECGAVVEMADFDRHGLWHNGRSEPTSDEGGEG